MERGTKKRDRWTMSDLRGKVAVVAGASRGAGRGIACVLGDCGATVYVTGRSVRGGPTTDQMPGTIEDTAEEVIRRGGHGIPGADDRRSPQDLTGWVCWIGKTGWSCGRAHRSNFPRTTGTGKGATALVPASAHRSPEGVSAPKYVTQIPQHAGVLWASSPSE